MQPTFSDALRLAVIGGGKMGQAIISGIVASGTISAADIYVVEPGAERRAMFVDTYGITAVPSSADLDSLELNREDLIIMAVKPQVFFDVIEEVKAVSAKTPVASIAVGIDTASIEEAFADLRPVVRVMPNTPAAVGSGMALVSAGAYADAGIEELVTQLFSLIGDAVVIDEKLQNAGAAISGSGPAYFALIIDSLARAGVYQGLSRELAERLAVQTMRGTAELIEQTGIHPEVLVDMVSSPGGTTIAALRELENSKVRSAFFDAVDSAVYRAMELAMEESEGELSTDFEDAQ